MMPFKLARSVGARVRALIRQAELSSVQDPALQQVAGEVYVGDIYSLREEIKVVRPDDGWGKRRYVCDSDVPLL